MFGQVHVQLKVSLAYFIIIIYYRIPVSKANSIDPDQTLRSAASGLGLYCLPMSFLWDARHKWINKFSIFYATVCLIA